MTPETLESAGPFVQGPDSFGVGAIEDLAAFTANMNQANVAQDTQVFGDGGLLEPQPVHYIADGALLERQVIEDLPAPGCGDGVEGVRRCSRSRHGLTIHSHMGMCQAIFFPPSRSRTIWRLADEVKDWSLKLQRLPSEQVTVWPGGRPDANGYC